MKIIQLFHTIKYLKLIQIRYQLWYRIRHILRKLFGFKYPLSIIKEGFPLKLAPFIPKYTSFEGDQFTFLNQSKTFHTIHINWNYSQYGKLWSYNLNYFDFIHQPEMDKKISLELINDYIAKLDNNSIGIEPYPTSLRAINWIKFISHLHTLPSHSLTLTSSLFAQYQILLNNLEYHLLGNHILENGFSLLFGGFFFKNEILYNKAKQIIETELEEQILEDGRHFELSPMYHQIILDRLLDSINLIQNNQRFDNQSKLLEFLETNASAMLSWLNNITFSNGKIPLLNDSAQEIAPTTKQLNKYAASLNLNLNVNLNIKNSGYRRYNGKNYECIIDIGQIGPSYQLGHAHADTFNFILNVNNKPFIIDTGISTYESNKIRIKERSTAAHNTVNIQGKNSSEVWSSFRVARRAKVNILKDRDKSVIAQHNGYKKAGSIHQREWHFSDHKMEITDTLSGKILEGTAHFHIASGIQPQKTQNTITAENTSFTFKGHREIKLIKTKIPKGYNQFQNNHKIEVTFNNSLNTIITIK